MQTSIWTDPLLVTNLGLFAKAGLSASQIANRLSAEHGITVTRNAVISKAFRTHIPLLQGKGNSIRPRRRMSVEERLRRRRDKHLAGRLKQRDEQFSEQLEKIAKTPPIEDIAIPVGQRCTLLQLTEDTCRWPVGDVGEADFFFCGGHAVKPFPYCACHSRVAYTVPSRTRKPYSAARRFPAWRGRV